MLMAVLAPRVSAQQPNPDRSSVSPFLLLEGLGSTIGISVRDADAEETRRAGTSGVVVQDVRDDTPAASAGLREMDIVVDFDGERVRSVSQFQRLVRETAPGRTVKMTLLRGGSRQTLDITPEPRGARNLVLPDIAADVRRGMKNLPRDFDFDFRFDSGTVTFGPQRLGVAVIPLSDQLASYFGVKQGVLVSAVSPDSPADTAGIKAGDVITTINGRTVSSTSDVVEAVRSAEPGSSVEVRVTRDRREQTLTPKMPERNRPVARRGRPV